MSTPWLSEGKEEEEEKSNEAKLHRTILKKKIHEGGLGGCSMDHKKFERIQSDRPVSWIKRRVHSKIFLLISLVLITIH